MADEIASTIVVGRANPEHRRFLTDRSTPHVSGEFAHIKLLCAHESECLSQLSDEHESDEFRFWIDMLHNAIGMFRTSSVHGDNVCCANAPNRGHWY
jgi:hypothetical protein